MPGNRLPLLLLCHRIPYPPNKGDKIRSFHWLKLLAEKYDVFLGAFIDDPKDWDYQSAVREFCRETKLFSLVPWKARLRSLLGLLSGEPLSVPYFYDPGMKRWINDVVARENIQHVLAFSSPMAQYLTSLPPSCSRRVVDMVDVDSEKWSQYAARKPRWQAWVYQREASYLAQFEHEVAARAAATLFVSEAEAALFRQRVNDPQLLVGAVPNGVDTEYFRPSPSLPDPFRPGERPVVFTGAMDYWANVDAASWFTRQVLPAIRGREPNACFYIVGSNPAPELRKLASTHVVITGRVEDVRPYLQHAHAVVAPMRVARGVQNKVLEGMSMAKTVVTTSLGLEGLVAQVGRHLLMADDPKLIAETVLRVMEDPHSASTMGDAARELIVREYSWSTALAALEAYIGCGITHAVQNHIANHH